MTKAQRKQKLIDSKKSFWTKWLPWRYIVRKFSQRSGFMDPLTIMAKLEQFAQPSEVGAPVELLRAGMVFHARGLVNTKAIQHNLDWVWPYWVEKQFDPASDSFVPRAFSISHINLTHRNWTCVGIPGCEALPIVDPRGLVTPYFDGWSLDAWVLSDRGELMTPSRLAQVEQDVDWSDGRMRVDTRAVQGGMQLDSQVWAEAEEDDGAACCVRWTASSPESGWLVVALRPANPEGVSFIHGIGTDDTGTLWQVDDDGRFSFDDAPDRHLFSRYHDGDVVHALPRGTDDSQIEDDVGLATAAMLFRLHADEPRTVTARIDLRGDTTCDPLFPMVKRGENEPRRITESALGACAMQHPNAAWARLFDIHHHNLLLHSPFEVYPGPFTYKRFWFRDAAYILYAMLCCGMKDRVRRLLDDFPSRQTLTGYYRSQEGEWDSNGQVLWLLNQYRLLTGEPIPDAWQRSIIRGARWIIDKREDPTGRELHAGLMPAGFSAEHLGTNDYYYWDDFWSVAGLRAAADMAATWGDHDHVETFRTEAHRMDDAIETSRDRSAARRRHGHGAFPASPYRRMDAGAIGSVCCGYPLQLYAPDDARLMGTVEFLLEHCWHGGGFFQDMIHSGINAYLTLHVAQVLLRADDDRALPIIQRIAELATSTGNWPEAIHPNTLGGCMGDGQHIWAAADWQLMMRAIYLRAEQDDTLVLVPGLDPRELAASDSPATFGPTPTRYGDITISAEADDASMTVSWEIDWRTAPKSIRIAPRGLEPVTVAPDQRSATMSIANAQNATPSLVK